MIHAVAMTRLDLMSSRPYLKQGVLLFAVAALLGFAMDDPGAVVPLTVVYAVLTASYPFAIGDKNDLDTLYAVIPVPRSAQLAGRYLFAVVLFLVAAGIGTVLAFVIALTQGQPLPTGPDVAMLVAVCFAFYALMVGLQYPMYVGLGYLKARLVANVPFMALLVAVLLFASRLEDVTLPSPAVAAPVLVAAGALVLLGSAAVAARLPRRDAR